MNDRERAVVTVLNTLSVKELVLLIAYLEERPGFDGVPCNRQVRVEERAARRKVPWQAARSVPLKKQPL